MMDSNAQIFKTLRASSLFEQVDDTVLSILSAQMTLENIQGGQLLIRQGELADCMYILVYGRLLVYENADEDNGLGEIGVGDVVGELGILIDTPRTANVVAIRDSVLIKISRSLFESIAHNHPQAAMRILASCVKRLLPTFKQRRQALKTLCIIPCESKTDVGHFTQRMSQALSHYAKTRVITHQDHQALDNAEINRMESDCDLMIFVGDQQLNDWTQQCIRQSDRVLLFCDADEVPSTQVSEYIHLTPSIKAKMDLVLLHPESTLLPTGTADYLATLKPNQHFHVATTLDYERVARYLLGRSITVVFSGGGLRGIAHHGLVRALQERDIPIDMAAGVSFGSLFSFMIAHKFDQATLYDIWAKLAPTVESVVDLTIPVTSLARGKRLYELLVEAFGIDQRIEDLWFPTFCISTNLTDYDAYLHDQGLTWQAIRASLSLPAIFPPVVMNQKLLVDGAPVNNLPVDFMRQMNNQGIVIASTVSEKTENHGYLSAETGLSGWNALYDRLTRKHPDYPGIADIIMDASLAASIRHQRAMFENADFAMDLGVSEFGMLEVKAWPAILQRGYENACRELDRMGITRQSLGL